MDKRGLVGCTRILRSQWLARLPLIALAIALPVLVASGCGGGESEADKAKSEACDAKSDISSQIDTLKGLPLTSSSVDPAKAALQAIKTDLQTIENALPTVEGSLKAELAGGGRGVQDSGTGSYPERHVGGLGIDRGDGPGAAVTTLETSYQQAFANVER